MIHKQADNHKDEEEEREEDKRKNSAQQKDKPDYQQNVNFRKGQINK